MSSTTLYRLSAVSLLFGSLLAFIGFIPGIFTESAQGSTFQATTSLIRIIGVMFIVLGLPGIYARLAGRAGVLGLIGFILTLFFLLMGMAGDTVLTFIFPFLAAHKLVGASSGPPLGLLIFYLVGELLEVIGGILLGIAVIRAAVSPRTAGAVLIVGSLLSIGNIVRLPVGDAGSVILIAGLAWLALGIWSRRAAMVEAQAPLPPTGVRA